MKTLLTTIIAASLSVGCAMLEGEQTTTESGGGGGNSSPSTPAPVNSGTWTKQFGTYGDDDGHDIATDSNGNFYVVGTTRSDRDGNNYNDLFNPAKDYLFLKKFNGSGVLEWSNNIEINPNYYYYGQHTYKVTTDVNNNIYISGPNNGNFNGNPVNNGIFIVKYDNDGNGKWIKNIDYSNNGYYYDSSSDIVINQNGAIYLSFYSEEYDSNTSNTIRGPKVFKLDTDGNELVSWQTNHSNNNYTCGGYNNNFDLTTDINDNIIITSGNEDSCGGSSSYRYISKFYDNGTEQWTQQLQTRPNNSCGGYYGEPGSGGLVSDSYGNIYVIGSGDLDNSSSNSMNCGSESQDFFIVKYSENGTQIWSDQIGSKYYNYEGYDNGISVTVDNSDNIFAMGTTEGAFDGTTNYGGRETFVVKYDSSGQLNWIEQFGTTADDRGSSITMDNAGNVLVTGSTNANLDNNLNSGGYDVFIVKIDTNGNKM